MSERFPTFKFIFVTEADGGQPSRPLPALSHSQAVCLDFYMCVWAWGLSGFSLASSAHIDVRLEANRTLHSSPSHPQWMTQDLVCKYPSFLCLRWANLKLGLTRTSQERTKSSKYFRIWGPYGLLQLLNSATIAGKQPGAGTYGHGFVPVKLYLQ